MTHRQTWGGGSPAMILAPKPELQASLAMTTFEWMQKFNDISWHQRLLTLQRKKLYSFHWIIIYNYAN